MNYKQFILLAGSLLIPFVFIGCAEKVWVKPGATQDEFVRNKVTCKQTAAQMTSALDPGNMFLFADQFNDCMTEHGWTLRNKADVN